MKPYSHKTFDMTQCKFGDKLFTRNLGVAMYLSKHHLENSNYNYHRIVLFRENFDDIIEVQEIVTDDGMIAGLHLSEQDVVDFYYENNREMDEKVVDRYKQLEQKITKNRKNIWENVYIPKRGINNAD